MQLKENFRDDQHPSSGGSRLLGALGEEVGEQGCLRSRRDRFTQVGEKVIRSMIVTKLLMLGQFRLSV